MAIHFLYGKNLSDKDNYIFTKMKKSIDDGNKILYIVPEQYAFSADRILLDFLSEKYAHLTETLNFKRMAFLVNSKYSPTKVDYIDEEVKNLILYRILKANQSKLTTIKNRGNNPDSILIFKDIISECKSHLIDDNTLVEIKEKVSDNKFLYSKMSDLALIISEYNIYIQDKYKDFEDSFFVLSKNISQNNLYKDYDIYIDNFTAFSPAELLIIESLMKNAKNINITLLIDDFSDKDISDLFYTSYRTYRKLQMLSEKHNIKTFDTNIDEKDTDFFVNLFTNEDIETKNEDIILTTAKNTKDEIRSVVHSIKKLVQDGESFSDISVLTGDLTVYEDVIEKEFITSNIPYFMDKKVPIIRNPLCRLFLSALNMVVSNFSESEILEYLKSLPFLFNNHKEICIFEEFIKRFNISKSNISNLKEWNKTLEIVKNYKSFVSFNINIIKNVYDQFMLPIIETFAKKENQKNIESFFLCYKSYIKSINLENVLKIFIETKLSINDTKQEYITVYNTFLKALKNINILLINEPFKLANYYNLLLQSLCIYTIGVLPNSVDNVNISDIERGRDVNKKYVFILGLNEGITPKSNQNISFLSDIERELIADISGIELPTTIWKNASSNLALYRAFISYTKKLYISQSEFTNDQTKLMSAFLWSRLVEITGDVNYFDKKYVNLSELTIDTITNNLNPYKSSKNQTELLNKLKEKPQIDELFENISLIRKDGYFDQNKKLDKKIIDTKFNRQLNTSVSRLESYKRCGYSYFIKFILKIYERENTGYDFRKTGTIVHNLIDIFSKKMREDKIDWEDLSEEYIDETLPPLVTKEIYHLFPDTSLFNPRTKYLIKKMNRTTKNAILYIKEHFIKGSFVPFGYEVEISKEGVPPLTISLEDGTVMQIFGKIDRGDKVKCGDKLYVRVIDYKSSAKEFNFALIKEGIQLQLLTYLKTVVTNGGEYLDFTGEILPGAVFYVAFDDAIVNFPYKPASEEVADKIKEKFMLKGLILNDDSLIGAIDKELSDKVSYKSDICDVKTDKEGNFSLKNLLFIEEFRKLLSECETTLSQIGNDISSGNIPIKPYKYGTESGCDYCPYKSVCLFDSCMHEYNYIGKLTKDDYFKVGEEDGI